MKKALLAAIFFIFFHDPSFAEEKANPDIFCNVTTHEKAIAITVDDCTVPKNIEKMLQVAERHGIKLTFFPIGKNVSSQAPLWKQVHELNHQIELHTHSHKSLNASEKQQLDEVVKNIEDVRRVLGQDMVFSFLRPPFGEGVHGKNRARLLDVLKRSSAVNGSKINVLLWSVDLLYIDGKISDSAKIRKTFMENLVPGNIFLFHGRKEDVVYFEEIVVYAKENGYKMVTLSELVKMKERSAVKTKFARLHKGETK